MQLLKILGEIVPPISIVDLRRVLEPISMIVNTENILVYLLRKSDGIVEISKSAMRLLLSKVSSNLPMETPSGSSNTQLLSSSPKGMTPSSAINYFHKKPDDLESEIPESGERNPLNFSSHSSFTSTDRNSQYTSINDQSTIPSFMVSLAHKWSTLKQTIYDIFKYAIFDKTFNGKEVELVDSYYFFEILKLKVNEEFRKEIIRVFKHPNTLDLIEIRKVADILEKLGRFLGFDEGFWGFRE